MASPCPRHSLPHLAHRAGDIQRDRLGVASDEKMSPCHDAPHRDLLVHHGPKVRSGVLHLHGLALADQKRPRHP